MSALEKLQFVRSAPVAQSGRKKISLLDIARKRLVNDLDVQIALGKNPDFEIKKTVKKRNGTIEETVHKPKSWVVLDESGTAYITIRFSNKVLPVGGKRGSIIQCNQESVVPTLETVRVWALSDEADKVLDKALRGAKRRKRVS